MNAQASRKLIVVGAMAAVVAVGVTTFAVRPHTATRVAQAITPPAPLIEPSAVAPDLGMTTAAATIAPPVAEAVPMPADAVTASATPRATDSEITAMVKAQIAGDSISKTASIAVATTNGVVALTGSLASQDEIEHIRLIVAAVKDVKSVDTTALALPTT